jgi:hypothetical protein
MSNPISVRAVTSKKYKNIFILKFTINRFFSSDASAKTLDDRVPVKAKRFNLLDKMHQKKRIISIKIFRKTLILSDQGYKPF